MAYGAGVVLVNVRLWELWARRSEPSKFLRMQGIQMLTYTDNSYNETQRSALFLTSI